MTLLLKGLSSYITICPLLIPIWKIEVSGPLCGSVLDEPPAFLTCEGGSSFIFPGFSFLFKDKIIITVVVIIVLCTCAQGHTPWHLCGGQRTIFSGVLPPWVLGI